MYDYGELEIKILCCFWLKPQLLNETILEEKHFKYSKKIFVLFKSFYKKFGNLDIESVCSLVNDPYKFMKYIEVIVDTEPTPKHFKMYESLLIELYNEAVEEKWLREKTFELANDFYLKNITSKEFKERLDSLYTHAKEICKND